MRPFVEFIQQEALPWSTGFLPGTRRRLLSCDDITGASSEITSIPAGWRQAGPRRPGADEEIFVLAGDITIAGERLSRFGYARFPAGYEIAEAHSAGGAVVVTFYSRDPEIPLDTEYDERKRVAATDCLRHPGSPLRTAGFTSSAKRIDLYDDPDTGESTWILANASLRCDEMRPEVHPVAEEMLLVAGEMHSPQGVMRPGAYFWRPADEWHGPFGSVGGAVCLFRTQGGPLSTVYRDDPAADVWDLDYKPILPLDHPIEHRCAPRFDEVAAWHGAGRLA